MSQPTLERTGVEGHVIRGFEAVREAFAENFARRRRAGRRLLRLSSRREGRRPLGRRPEQADRRAVGADTMVIVYSATKGLAAMTLAVAHSRGWLDYEERVCTTGRSSRSTARSGSPSGSCWRTRPGCSRSTSRWIARSSPISIGWPSCWRGRSRRGSRARGRRITRSRSGSTKASCCAASIRGIAASDSSSRTRSRRRSDSTSTSACPSRSRTRRLATLAGLAGRDAASASRFA